MDSTWGRYALKRSTSQIAMVDVERGLEWPLTLLLVNWSLRVWALSESIRLGHFGVSQLEIDRLVPQLRATARALRHPAAYALTFAARELEAVGLLEPTLCRRAPDTPRRRTELEFSSLLWSAEQIRTSRALRHCRSKSRAGALGSS